MKATIKFFIVAVFAFFMGMGSVGAQGWERIFTFGKNSSVNEMTQTSDSCIWLAGFFDHQPSSIQYRSLLVKLDKKGIPIFTKHLSNNSLFYYISPISDNGVLVSSHSFVDKFDKNGNLKWEIPTDNLSIARELSNGNILLIDGEVNINNKISLFSKNADKIWEKPINAGYYLSNLKIYNNEFVLYMTSLSKSSLKLIYDLDGNLKSSTIISPKYGAAGFIDLQNNIYLTIEDVFENGKNKQYLVKFSDKKVIWKRAFPNWSVYGILITSNNKIIISASEYAVNNTQLSSAILAELDTSGLFKNIKRYKDDGINEFGVPIEQKDGYFLAAGSYNFNYIGIDSVYASIRVVKTKIDTKVDSILGIINSISGKVKIDENKNCKADSIEKKVKKILIQAKNAKNESYYTLADSEGNYQIFADTGKYTVKATLPSPYFKQICDSTITLTNTLNTTPLDILLQKTITCPYLSVDISTQGFRPCMSSVQTIKYCNQGSEAAKNAYVSLTLDPNLTYETSSIPAVLQANGSYKFALGNVPFDTCATFTVTTKTKCDNTLTGKTLCNKVHIYPDSICIINNNAKVQVAGNCTGTKIDFNIKNFGQANMIAAKNYLIIEDDVMFKQGTFNLGAGQTLPISITPKAGKTYRIIAEQTDATLGAIATTAFEACVPSANSSTGFINQFSLGDDSPFEDEDCRVVTNSFDPNDKQGFPTGVRSQHFIPKNTDIEYMIRFQNTGTDTAFVVVLKDTLSAFLDPATIQPGASSHVYKFDLTDNGIAKFAFYNINLSHEKADKDGSNGFVKFRVKQRANNPNGTVIKNRAGIYFDYNDPIITNTTTHTIGENWMQIIPTQEPNVSNVVVKVFPNPFNESTRIEVQAEDYKNLVFNLLDMNGKVIRSEKFDENSLDFSRNDLLGGFYLYQIQSEGKVLQSGKLVVQ